MTPKTSTSLLALAALAGLVRAGPGASMNACVFLPVAPSGPLTINFQAGASTDACMNDRGSNAQMQVTQQGVTCTSIGYVEAKTSSSGGDTCATDQSHWGLSWSSSDGTMSGSTNSRWYASKKIELQEQSANTYICGSPSTCTQTYTGRSGQGPLWIIFEPNGAPSYRVTDSLHEYVMENTPNEL